MDMTPSDVPASGSVEYDVISSNQTPSSGSGSPAEVTCKLETVLLDDVLQRVLCVVGILGNILNLLVLGQKQVKGTVGSMERSAHLGLVLLAVSDLTFCVSLLAKTCVPDVVFCGPACSSTQLAQIWFTWFHILPGNTLILTSTWLMVILAYGRYRAVCHPFQARGSVNTKVTWALAGVVLVLAAAFNLPDLLQSTVVMKSQNESVYYYIAKSPGMPKETMMYYYIFRFIIGICVPVIIQIFCTFYLIRALKESYRVRTTCTNQRPESGHRITSTLIVLIICFVLLVTPVESIQFVKHLFPGSYSQPCSRLNIIYRSLNLLQITNFSLNFVVYCLLNVHFRSTLRALLCCRSPPAGGSRPGSQTERCYSTRWKTNQATTLMMTFSEAETDV